jgi:hypothetical protein
VRGRRRRLLKSRLSQRSPPHPTDADTKAHDRVAVNVSQALCSADAHSLGEGGDDLDLPVEGEVVRHGANPCCGSWTDRRWREGDGFAIFPRVVIAMGANPGGVIRAGAVAAAPAPFERVVGGPGFGPGFPQLYGRASYP